MPDAEDLRFRAAEYRVRLFLSVDLSGSTAFKNSRDGQDRESGPTPKWVTVFQNFYSAFPGLFAAEFHKSKTQSAGDDKCPKLWKAVGDELVFCGRVGNMKSCSIALDAFMKTLLLYRRKLDEQGVELNVKGAAWLAAFPEPNRTVQLRKSDFLPSSEELELAADDDPFQFDFLGKAIDTGFRVASRSQPDRFVLSVQLARLLASNGKDLGFARPVRLEPPSTLKGVNKNVPYPMLYIDTLEHLPMQKAKRLERNVFGENETDQEKLAEYLIEYCSVVGTDEIKLKPDYDADEVDPPASYLSHRDKIFQHLAGERKTDFDGENGVDTDLAGDEVDLDEAMLAPLNKRAELD